MAGGDRVLCAPTFFLHDTRPPNCPANCLADDVDDFAACGGRTEVSLYEYNTICRQDEDWDQIIKDAWDHERAHGEVGLHLARVMDPVAVIEGIFAPTEARLRQFVVNRIGEYDVKYGNEIVDRVRNVTPYRRITIWYWHPLAQRFWSWPHDRKL